MVELIKKIYKLSTKNNPYLFSINNEKNENITVDIKDVNEYLIKYSITSKDLRTWNANIIFIKNLKHFIDKGMGLYKQTKNKYNAPADRVKLSKKLEKQRKSIVKEAIQETATSLHHTPTICKNSYLFKNLVNNMLETEDIINELSKNTKLVPEDYLSKVLKKFGSSKNCK